MVMHIKKPETEPHLGSNKKEKKFRYRFEQDWSKVCWREIENGGETFY